jgi:cell shape-determining protein MreD
MKTRRILVLFGTLLLLWAIVAQFNHALTAVRVHVFVGALFVGPQALLQRMRTGLPVSLLGGLLFDATTPVVFGTHMVLFAAAHAAVHHMRDRLPRDDAAGRIVMLLLVNLGLFLVFSFTQIHRSPAPAAIWPRLLVDLLCSQIFLSLITPWFFALQQRALVLARAERENLA